MRFRIFLALMLVSLTGCQPSDDTDRAAAAMQHVRPHLGHAFGRPVFLRIVKETRTLELRVQEKGRWRLLKTYPILAMSGELGPKTAEGDRQAPEGFYATTLPLLNPRSKFHLSFNIGYPNAYDRNKGRTGSFIMVHGSNRSIGCFAMGDPAIEEIYTLVHQALKAGQSAVPVQIYPFEMTPERMEQERNSPHYDFWQSLLPGWQHTHLHGSPVSPQYR